MVLKAVSPPSSVTSLEPDGKDGKLSVSSCMIPRLPHACMQWAIPEIRCTPLTEDMEILQNLPTFFIGNPP